MTVTEMGLPGVLLLEPQRFEDDRGAFWESWHRARYADVLGSDVQFVQDNVSVSKRGVLRGLHFQNPTPQGKLVSVLQGAVVDVVVDLRADGPTFKQWLSVELSADNHRQMYVPVGFAHGFVVVSEVAVFSYKCTGFYCPGHERSLRWNDPEIGIRWPIEDPTLSPKDAAAPLLSEVRAEDLFSNESLKRC